MVIVSSTLIILVANLSLQKGETALILACSHSYTEIVEQLVQAKADLDIQQKVGHLCDFLWCSLLYTN